MLDNGDQQGFNAAMNFWLKDPQAQAGWRFRARPYRLSSPFEVFTAVRNYNLTDVARNITTPLFICDPEGEQFWPGQSQTLAQLVAGPAELVAFTAAEGADLHCEPMARTLVHQRMFDWLTTVLGPLQPATD